MIKLVLRVGVGRFLMELTGVTEEDFRHWNLDKTARGADRRREDRLQGPGAIP